MPGLAHNDAHTFWTMAMAIALQALTQLPYPPVPPGCRGIGAISMFHRTHNLSGFTLLHLAYEVGPGKKQADAGLRCSASVLPSVVLEVGSSESFIQLQTDAKLWIEDMPEVCQFLFLVATTQLFTTTHWNFFQVCLVILLFIDPPIAPYPTLPRFTIQLWRGFPAVHSRASQQREARMVWDADWTHVATPMYILLADIFRGGVPAAYGMNTHVYLDTTAWRQDIIDSWKLL